MECLLLHNDNLTRKILNKFTENVKSELLQRIIGREFSGTCLPGLNIKLDNTYNHYFQK